MNNTNTNYGFMYNEQDIKLQRAWFKEMCDMYGVMVQYYAPLPDKHWTTYSEIKSNYHEPQRISAMYNEIVDQRTMKLLGWVAELGKDETIISVPYDLEGLQVGALFMLPSAIDGAEGRLFRATMLSTYPIYPASVTCRLVLEYKDTCREQTTTDFSHSSFNVLNRGN